LSFATSKFRKSQSLRQQSLTCPETANTCLLFADLMRLGDAMSSVEGARKLLFARTRKSVPIKLLDELQFPRLALDGRR